MPLTALRALVVKDLRIFFSDRRSVIVSFVVPIAIASFFGSVFSGGDTTTRARVQVAIVDLDASTISRGIVSGARADESLDVTTPSESEAREAVRAGSVPVAVVIPKGFGDASGAAFLVGGDRPALELLYDPSSTMELAMVRGVMTQHVMQAVSREMLGGTQGRQLVERTLPQLENSGLPEAERRSLADLLGSVQRYYQTQDANGASSAGQPQGLAVPYTVQERAVTAGVGQAYNGYAHSFGGMAIQFLLFAMANLGVELLLERQKGLWKRLRSAPVSKLTLLLGKAASGTLVSMLILGVCFAFAMAVFGVRIHGSLLGFVAVAVSCSLMAASFGLLVASLGNSPATARGITSMAVLMMVMLGGAWVPTFVFPEWLQQVARVVPVRWAMDGFDAMTWRGLGVGAAVAPALLLCAFAAVFAAVAVWRFRWDEA